MGILTGDQPKEPMHYGEIFSVWGLLHASQTFASTYQIYLNHTGDQDLHAFIENVIQHVLKPEIEQTMQLLKENGIALPPSPPDRPHCKLEDIPAGARFNDSEIAAALSVDLAAGLVTLSQGMGMCTREDIAAMFGTFHMKKSQYLSKLLKLNKNKGWLVLPPMQIKQPELV